MLSKIHRRDTIHVHSECVKIITILLSAPLYNTSPSSSPSSSSSSSSSSSYLQDIMSGRCSSAAPQLICTLLSNAVREPLPQTHSVSSYLWSYVPFSSTEKTLYTDTQFFKECLMLVLLLTNLTSQSDNPYKQSLNTFGHREPSSNVNNTCFVMDLDLLYCYFCKDTMQTSEQDTLLLYTLIQVSCVTRGTQNLRHLPTIIHLYYSSQLRKSLMLI